MSVAALVADRRVLGRGRGRWRHGGRRSAAPVPPSHPFAMLPGMTRIRTLHACTECGTAHPKWSGQCSGCGAWNTLVEESAESSPPGPTPRPMAELQLLHDIDALLAEARPTGIGELDRVLDGGLVPGSVTLLGGEPGIGKSTLLLQLLAWWPGADAVHQRRGEPAAGAHPGRAARRGARRPVAGRRDVARRDRRRRWTGRGRSVIVVDSIQTIADHTLSSPPGSMLPGPGVRPAADRRGQAARRRHRPRRPRHQGRRARRSARARARRRHRAVVRGRPPPRAAACCAPSSTASARPTSSGCSR